MTACVQSIQLNLLNMQALPRSDRLVQCCFQIRRFYLYLEQLYRFPTVVVVVVIGFFTTLCQDLGSVQF
jgi:hypothetical protein